MWICDCLLYRRICHLTESHVRIQRVGGGSRGQTTSTPSCVKSQVAKDFHWDTGADPSQEAIGSPL